MKIFFIYAVLIAAFYFVDSALDLPFIEVNQIKGSCEKREFPPNNHTIECCGYIWIANETMATFYYKSFETQIEKAIYYQQFSVQEKLNLSELMHEDTSSTFPFINENEQGIEELKKHGLQIVGYESKRVCNAECENYLMTNEVGAAYAYIILIKGLTLNTIEVYFKNNLKYLEDSFVTFLCFVIMTISIRLINEDDEDDQNQFGKYIKSNQPHLLLIIVLIAQPLRPLCYFTEFEAIEWIIGQGFYSIGEFLFLRYFLQVMSFLKGQTNQTNRIRNTLISIFAILPISLDRMTIAFFSQNFVIKDIENQIDNIEMIMKICWICFLLYSSVFAYDIMISLQTKLMRNDLFVTNILFFVVYAFQKSHFYLYYEHYDHHLFNPINMLMIVSYVGILLTLDLKKNNESSQENELSAIRHQIDQDEEHGENIESTIAEYYKEREEQVLI